MSAQDAMFETPVIAAMTGDAYQKALGALVATCRAYLEHEDPDLDDLAPLTRHGRQISAELRAQDFRPRERMSRAEVHRSALQRLARAIEEYAELADYDGGALGLNVWEAFEREVKSAARTAESYGPYDTTWAPEDDTNPVKVVEVPQPDPSAPPINGIRQGAWVKASWEVAPRRVLTGADDKGYVRLSDRRDGGGGFGGYFIEASSLGATWADAAATDEQGERDA